MADGRCPVEINGKGSPPQEVESLAKYACLSVIGRPSAQGRKGIKGASVIADQVKNGKV